MEKEIKKTDVAGKAFEDLDETEMKETQGQGGDVNAETTPLTISAVVSLATGIAASKQVCK